MKDDRWQRVEELFHAALRRPPEDRGGFLDEACGGDAELRDLVESLVSKDESADGFLDKAALAPTGPGSAVAQGSQTGRQYGPYHLVALLGAGGMGEVYRAHDLKLGRDVAIKTLPIEFARDPRRLVRFRREARTLAALNHPNIGAIYGLEESDDGDFLVLELVEGDALQGPRPVAVALDLAAQVADALHAAHEHGIVHRDLKPANVRVTHDGVVKVLDFGLAKAAWAWGSEAGAEPSPGCSATAAQSTVTGHILGTPGYMSPEQARGEAVDQRTDIWAFGCLLYELLTGERAFAAATAADAVLAVLEREPDWQALPADVPGEVRALLQHCLQKDRESRTRSIAEVRGVLRRADGPNRGTLPGPTPGQAIRSAGSIDAYELCLRARHRHLQRTAEGLETALRLFEQAIARDPNCAVAYAGIAHVLLLTCYFGGLPTSVGMPKMKAAALRALELDDTLAVGHVRLADALLFKDWDWAGAEREFRRALELDSDSTEGRWRYGLFLWARGRHQEALVQVREGLALDPLSLDANWILGWVLNSLRKADQAEEVAGRMLAMDPNVWLGYHVRAVARLLKGEDAAGLEDFKKMAEIEGGPAMHSALCWCYARLGRLDDAHRTMERIEQMMAHRHAPPGWLVWAYHGLGDAARARACFEQAIEERHMMMVHFRGHTDLAGGFEEFEPRLDELGL